MFLERRTWVKTGIGTGLLCVMVALGLAAEGGRARAQEPAATLVITQPTPTVTPGGPALASQGATGDATRYIVRPGDTLLTVALETGIDPEEVGCLVRPDFRPSEPLVIGDALQALPAGTLCHRVAAGGETVEQIAARYGPAADNLLREPWNRLAAVAGLPLDEGRYVRVPLGDEWQGEASESGRNGSSPFVTWMLGLPANTPVQQALGTGGVRRPVGMSPVPADWPYGTGHFEWPAYGFLTQGYRYDHRAIDIAATWGDPVTAADRGVVIRAGWNFQGYGQFVVIDHNIDYVSLYAHMDALFVREGDVVAKGQVLGTVGDTGNSTGPHLHFEIRDFGRLTNPLELLGR